MCQYKWKSIILLYHKLNMKQLKEICLKFAFVSPEITSRI